MNQIRKVVGGVRRKLLLSTFGNAVSLPTNTLYSVYHQVSRMKYARVQGQTDSQRSQERARDFERDGFLKFDPYLPQDLITSVARRTDELFERPELVVDHRDQGLIRLKGSLSVFPELEMFITDEIAGIVEAYFGSHFKIFGTDIYRTVPSKAQEENSFLWHFDNGPTKLIKLMIYLDPTTKDTGGFRLKPKPLSLQLKRQGFWDRKDADRFRAILEDESTTRLFEGPPGTAVLFHALYCIHKATFPKHGHRDVATFLLHPSTIPWKAHLALNRAKMSRNFGYCINPFTDKPLRVGDE